jgi:hypothetical protein
MGDSRGTWRPSSLAGASVLARTTLGPAASTTHDAKLERSLCAPFVAFAGLL